MDDVLRYPTGKWKKIVGLDAAGRAMLVEQIAALPAAARAAVSGLNDDQLDTAYRDGGWSPRQIVHHLADSHLNAFTRFKLGLTEDNPTIRPYDEKAWAETVDSRETPVDLSLTLLEGLHGRWARLLAPLDEVAYQRTIEHPENGTMTLDALLQLYAWHGHHHVTQMTALRERMGW